MASSGVISGAGMPLTVILAAGDSPTLLLFRLTCDYPRSARVTRPGQDWLSPDPDRAAATLAKLGGRCWTT